MSNSSNKCVASEAPPEQAKKAWKKPVLDILELESAELGHKTHYDGHSFHGST